MLNERTLHSRMVRAGGVPFVVSANSGGGVYSLCQDAELCGGLSEGWMRLDRFSWLANLATLLPDIARKLSRSYKEGTLSEKAPASKEHGQRR
jgi:hypothetical protein